MYPELFHIGSIPIRSYGVMLAISFFLGVLYVQRMTRRDNRDFDPFLIIAYIMILGGIIGARLAYVVTHLSEFEGHWTATFNPFASNQFGIAGLTLYGGVILAIGGTFLYCYVKKLNVLSIFDYFAPTLGLGLFFTRIGCFLNGCCFGTQCDLPWAVHFPPGSIPYQIFGDTAIHPAQLYSSLYGLILFIALHLILRKRAFVGQVVAVAFMSEAFFRFVVDYVRYYEKVMYISVFGLNITLNQVVSFSLFAAGLAIYLIQRKRISAQTTPTPA